MKEDSFITFEENGKKRKFKVVATFEYDNRTYIIYTALRQKNKTLKTYAGIYNAQKNIVTPIRADKDYVLVESFLNKVG